MCPFQALTARGEIENVTHYSAVMTAAIGSKNPAMVKEVLARAKQNLSKHQV